MSDKQKYLQTIEENASLFTDVSDQIWDFAELSLMEFQSAKLYCEVLAKEGFTGETPIAGSETAFKASYGSGKPVIGIIGEYVGAIWTQVKNKPLVIEEEKINFDR